MKKTFLALLCGALVPFMAFAAPPVVATVHLEAPIRGELVVSVLAELELAKLQSATELVIHIDSPGGNLGDMLVIIKAITATNLPTTCVVGDMAASAAFIILQSSACAVRVVHSYSVLMAHSARVVMSDSASAVELQERVEDLNRADRAVALRICSRLGLTADEYLAKIQGKEWTTLGENAVTQRLADKIIP